ncbi:hypothetical protein [Mycolicibacterium gadium]|jgi:hypothetical protein
MSDEKTDVGTNQPQVPTEQQPVEIDPRPRVGIGGGVDTLRNEFPDDKPR